MSVFDLLAPRKNWTDFVVNSVDTKTLVAETVTIDDLVVDDLTTNLLTLNNQMAVPNAPVNATSFWSSGNGNLSQTDEFGATVQYTTLPPAGSYVVGSSPSVVGNLPSYDSLTGNSVSDSGIASSNIFLADGSVSATGNFDLDSNEIKNVAAVRTVNGVNIGSSALSNLGIAIGDNSIAGNGASTAVGNSASASGFGSSAFGYSSVCSTNNSMALGLSSNNSGVGGLAIGRNATNSAIDGISIGTGSNCSSQNSICIGNGAIVSAGSSISIGLNANNSVANSCLIGNSSITNIRPNNNGNCDLGVNSTNRFNNAYLNGCFIGTSNRPVDVGLFSQYTDINVNNTVNEISITSGSAVGSLIFGPTPLGAMFDFSLSFVVSSVAGDSLDIRWYTNAGLLFTNSLIIPALSTDLPVTIFTKVIVRNGNINVTSTSEISGVVATIVGSSIVYDRTVNNTWNVTAQWGANVNQMTVGMFNVKGSYSNTA